ncbi:hypothetical protein ABZ401_16250 [Streptomyces sp. NPDC005892]|uniref:hypothetical protein n=1 Tax=Streptomyces sp. NPDC005892 TaxID=3155593 RepID=UPI0033F76AF8
MGAGTSRTRQTMPAADDLRTRAAKLEKRVKPTLAGPHTDDEHRWLDKAAALRAEADKLDAAEK